MIRSTTYRLKRFSDVAFPPCASEDLQDFRQEDLFTMFCYFAPVTTICFLEKTFLRCLTVGSEFLPEKPTMNQDLNQELRRERWEREFEAREKCEGAHEEGGRETPARRPLFFSFLTSTRRMLKS